MCMGQVALAQDKGSEELTAVQFREKLDASPGSILIDVRTPEEVEDGKIPNALNIDFNADDFEDRLSKLDRNRTCFVYCAAGVRSGKAVAIMKELGFTRVYDLGSGYKGWVKAGLPTVLRQ